MYRWIRRLSVSIAIAIAALILYVTLVSAFLVYMWKQDRDADLRRAAIAECLDSGGHIGREDTCWHSNGNDDVMGSPSTETVK
jgi:hypothetical protein